jgi:hypothetical protein
MEIGVAYAAGFSFDQNLARSGRGNVPFHEVQRFPKSLLRPIGICATKFGSARRYSAKPPFLV